MSAPPSSEESRLLALLESQHDFPGPFSFKVIFRNEPGLGPKLVAQVCAATNLPEPTEPPTERKSSAARFVSMTVELQVRSAQDVLAVYRYLQGVDSVISSF